MSKIEFQKFGGILDIIDNYYVDSVNTAELIDKAIIATLENLDPHSVYIPKKEVFYSPKRSLIFPKRKLILPKK